MPPHVLIVEDDPNIRDLIVRHLGLEGLRLPSATGAGARTCVHLAVRPSCST
jgi:DNA-binding response OmpR family regulator